MVLGRAVGLSLETWVFLLIIKMLAEGFFQVMSTCSQWHNPGAGVLEGRREL